MMVHAKTLSKVFCLPSKKASALKRKELSALKVYYFHLTLLLLNTTCPVLANSVDPDQLASESALFVIKYVNFYQKPRSMNLIGWKLEVSVPS